MAALAGGAASDSSAPATSTKTGKKRKLNEDGLEEDGPRPLAASCNACRAKKVKCDSQQPCASCSRSSTACEYRNRLKPGLKAGTSEATLAELRELREAVAELKQQVQKHEEWYSSVESGRICASSSFPDENQEQASELLQYSSRETASIPLSLQCLPEGLMTGGDAASSHNTIPTPASTNVRADPSPEQQQQDTDFPPAPVVRYLIGLYYNHVEPSLSLLCGTSPESWNEPWSLAVHAMVAIAARFDFDPNTISKRESWRRYATQLIVLRATMATTVDVLQALAILCVDLIGGGHSPADWGVLALLTRSVTHLSLGFEPAELQDGNTTRRLSLLSPSADCVQEEQRRRLFFLVFMLDRYTCVATGWDFALQDGQFDRRLPMRDDLCRLSTPPSLPQSTPYFDQTNSALLDSNAHTSSYLILLLGILGRTHSYQSKSLDLHEDIEPVKGRTLMLVASLKRCWAAVPICLQRPPTMNSGTHPLTMLIHATYHATTLRMCARLAYADNNKDEYLVSLTVEAVTRLADLARIVTNTDTASGMSPFFIWCIWVAARVAFVHLVSASHAASREFDALLACLRQCGIYWSSGVRYARVLEKASSSWARLQSIGFMDPQAIDSRIIGALLDMRSTAYTAVAQCVSGTTTPVHPTGPTLSFQDGGLSTLPLFEDAELAQWLELDLLNNLL